MEQEVMQNNASDDSLVRHVFTLIKRNIILILAIIIIAGAVGVWYSYNKKPTYTASTRIVFVAKHTDTEDTKQDLNTMKAYFATVVDFCDEVVVLDRANFYYYDYVNNYQKEDSKLSDLIAYLKDDTRLISYEENKTNEEVKAKYIDKNLSKGCISIDAQTSSTEDFEPYFTLSYNDANKNYAIMKDIIVVTAANDEINLLNEDGENAYFAGMEVTLTEVSASPAVSSNVSKRKIVVYALIIGVIIAALVVAVKTLLDNTVKSRDELVAITNAPVFASIKKWEGKRYE